MADRVREDGRRFDFAMAVPNMLFAQYGLVDTVCPMNEHRNPLHLILYHLVMHDTCIAGLAPARRSIYRAYVRTGPSNVAIDA